MTIGESGEQILKALRAVQADAKAKGIGRGAAGQGEIACPCCEGGTLHYSVAGSNGHVWGRCSTPGCVRWLQ
jgi:hypothetical protein